MRKILSSTLFLFAFIVFAKAQYWQQEVNYTIKVKLNDEKHELFGDESFEYINNSPHTLEFIYIHLWPNAYKDNNTALAKQLLENGETNFYWSKEEDRGYIDGLDFKVNGELVKFEYDPEHIDIGKITLNKALLPGEKVLVTTPFHVKIPDGRFSRLGHIGQSYQITQWYPKPAVFDAKGWHPIPYLTLGEFYSEYGSFDVSISLPKNYVLGATGDMVNGEDEIKWLNENAEKTLATKNFDEDDMAFPASSTDFKTLRFKQSKVHDFAWFADKRYHVLRGEVELPVTKRKVLTWAMFTNSSAKAWMNSIQYLNDAVYYYSLWNGEYPYNHCTAVDGSISAGGGMEYPNITVIGETKDPFGLDVVITHEVGHNWFYGILGSNERDHAWMDEGINSYNEMRYVATKYPDKDLAGEIGASKLGKAFDLEQYKQRYQYYLMYLFTARRNEDQPMEITSSQFTEINYGAIVYQKTAIEFQYLAGYLGQELFDKCMHNYYEQWKFKHPQPEDIRKVFEETTGKNLSWFFDEIIKTNKKIDYKILSVRKETDLYYIKLKNTGDIAGPVAISAVNNNEKRVATLWYEGFNGSVWLSFPPGEYSKFIIDFDEEMPEINRRNNNYGMKKVFKKSEPLKLQFLGSIENRYKNQVYWAPVAGWNAYNKFQAGVVLYNNTIPQKKFDYILMPMFSAGTKSLSGYSKIGYNFYPNSIFQKIRIGADVKRYAFMNWNWNYDYTLEYLKIAPELSFDIKKQNERSRTRHNIRIREVNLLEDRLNLVFNTDGTTFLGYKKETFKIKKYILDIAYHIHNSNAINPYNFNANIQQYQGDVRLSCEANYRISYKKKKKGFDIRIFAGKIFGSNNSLLAFNLSGNNDYLYDYTLLARNGYFPGGGRPWLPNAQFVMKDGGFKNLTTVASSSNFMLASNLQASLPFIPVALYADFGFTENTTYSNQQAVYTTSFENNMGVALIIAPKICEVYFPLFQSSNLSNLKYIDRVRLTINFNMLDPFAFITNFSL